MPKQTYSSVPLATADSLRASAQRARRIGHLKGRQASEQALAEVRGLIGSAPPDGHRRDLLIEHLHVLNDHYRALFERHLVGLAAEMKLPMVEVFEVASFYHHFLILPDDQTAPVVTVRVCDGLSCAMAGANALLRQLPGRLADGVRVLPAPCIGRCEQAPAALVGQQAVPHATAPLIQNAVQQALSEIADFPGVFKKDEPLEQVNKAQEAINFVSYQAYRAAGGYALAAALVNGEEDVGQVLRVVEDAGLRGLGGAGFATGRKWRIVREQAAPRLLAVNLDEGEPGTFKDRTYLERDPHRFLEGMLVAAQVVGTEACVIYLRDEYHAARAMLMRELAALQADPPCPLPQIELRRGAGAYICGEESAMIESIEGKRGQPRLRPPYVAEVGLFGRPSLVQNFETLYWVRDIVEKGPQWLSTQGRQGRSGLRSFSVSGRVAHPGVWQAPAGISVRELIDDYCGGMLPGHTLYAYLPGGASGGILPASLSHLPLDFDTLQPHGCFIGSAAVVVLSQLDRARDAAHNAMQFFAHESCGQCTPCRVGTVKAAALMQAPVWDSATLHDLAQVMGDASICGLGQAAPNPMLSVLRYFAHEVS
ncbi:MAG: NADH-ubiquinone oxidoreductase-F iron-sulfur binding region domain-containing protein [Rhodoferax sp.]|uniref:NADH-ubiquinone oxidoreductase-F iron-sulfur binding region domain-containing protein n=1 Tax=Rhodoferax sp. TaxID=50421 RepID=UPI00260499F7|nr:NADH-ubiquinone oxidoreductase-F iron-sulfur binding region domain-containing protein [Rhodoferax sp.]MDD2880362.1 NADH-ubiquinone oxidoreductase-F iron-sulfur binding region domain-containing protein [Rhodoferax sp.]